MHKCTGVLREAALLALTLGALSMPVHAQQAVDQMTIEAGGQIVQDLCTPCHATAPGQSSPHPDAPSMRTLSLSYPVERLAEALAEGMMVGHPDMPVFEFDPKQVDQIIVYLNSIQDPR